VSCPGWPNQGRSNLGRYNQEQKKYLIFRNDHDLRIFLTFDGELEVRGKNAKEKITSWFNKGQQAFDNIISDKQTDPDDFYESKKLWLNEYHTRLVGRSNQSNHLPRIILLI